MPESQRAIPAWHLATACADDEADFPVAELMVGAAPFVEALLYSIQAVGRSASHPTCTVIAPSLTTKSPPRTHELA